MSAHVRAKSVMSALHSPLRGAFAFSTPGAEDAVADIAA